MKTKHYFLFFVIQIELSMFNLQLITKLTKLEYYKSTYLSWNVASSFCLGTGGKLVEPSTITMSSVVDKKGSHNEMFWIGIIKSGGNIRNGVTCSTPDYIASLENQDKKCFQMTDTDNKWESKDCDDKTSFLCERQTDDPCYYEDETGRRAKNSASSSMKQSSTVASLDECKQSCSSAIDASGNCWALVFTTTTNLCELYFNNNPYQFDNDVSDSSKVISRKRCFDYIEISTDYMTKKDPTDTYSCSAEKLYWPTLNFSCPEHVIPTTTACPTVTTTLCPTVPTTTPVPALNCSSCPFDNSSCPTPDVIIMNCTNHTVYVNVTQPPSICPTVPTTAVPPTINCSTCPFDNSSCPVAQTVYINNCTNNTSCPTLATTEAPPLLNCSTCPFNVSLCPLPNVVYMNCTNHTEYINVTQAPVTCPTVVTTEPLPVLNCSSCPVSNVSCPTPPTLATCPVCATTVPSPNVSCPITLSNLTSDEKIIYVAKLIKELQIDTKNLSSNKRKYKSADDPRPSAQSIGITGVAVLGSLMGMFFVLDMQHFSQLIKNVKFLCTGNTGEINVYRVK